MRIPIGMFYPPQALPFDFERETILALSICVMPPNDPHLIRYTGGTSFCKCKPYLPMGAPSVWGLSILAGLIEARLEAAKMKAGPIICGGTLNRGTILCSVSEIEPAAVAIDIALEETGAPQVWSIARYDRESKTWKHFSGRSEVSASDVEQHMNQGRSTRGWLQYRPERTGEIKFRKVE